MTGPSTGTISLNLSQSFASELEADENVENDDDGENLEHCASDMVLDGLADAEDELGEAGQFLAVAQGAFKDFLELRNNHDHQNAHDGGGHDHDGAGIEHGGDDFALDLLGLFHEFGEALEHHFQHAADFAGFDHVDEETIKDLGMLGQRLGEGAAAFDGNGQIAQNVFQVGAFFLFLQHAQAAQQGQSGLHQCGQLPGEGAEDLGFDAAAQAGNFDL